MIVFLIILAVVILILGLAYFNKLSSTGDWVIRAIGAIYGMFGKLIKKWGPRVFFGSFVLLGTMAISLLLIVAGVTTSKPLTSGIGCLISLFLFLLTWSPIGFIWGLLGPKNFGSRMYPTIVRALSFWLVFFGLLAMIVPSVFAEQMASATLTQKLTIMVGTMLFSILLATLGWTKNKAPTFFMRGAIFLIIALVGLTGLRLYATENFDSQVAVWKSEAKTWLPTNKQKVASNNEKSGRLETVYRNLNAATQCLYNESADGLVAVAKSVKKGQTVQVLNSAEPIIFDEIAYLKIKLPDSYNRFASGKTYLIEASLLSEGMTDHTPGAYAVATTQRSPLNKVGLGGTETRKIIFDADTITVENLPVGKVVQYNGAEIIKYFEPRDSAYYNIEYGRNFQSPASLKLAAEKGAVMTITIKS